MLVFLLTLSLAATTVSAATCGQQPVPSYLRDLRDLRDLTGLFTAAERPKLFLVSKCHAKCTFTAPLRALSRIKIYGLCTCSVP